MNRYWVSLFGFWLVLLSGVLTQWGGSPGILQALRLRSLLGAKKQLAAQLQAEVQNQQFEVGRLNRNRFAQEKEIRRVLGYAASDELVFEITGSD